MKTHRILSKASTLTTLIERTQNPHSFDLLAASIHSIENGVLGEFKGAYLCDTTDEAGAIGETVWYEFVADGLRIFRQLVAQPRYDLATAPNLHLLVMDGDTIAETSIKRPNTPGRRALCAVDCKALGNIFFTF